MQLGLCSKVFHMLSPPATYLRQIASLLAIAVLLGACAGTGAPQQQSPAREPVGSSHGLTTAAAKAASIAVRQVGVPYSYGGSDPAGFDCSGLVQYAYANAGKRLPRTTGGLWEALEAVPAPGLEKGDVLFFNIEGKMSHVGLYIGKGRFVHAPSSGKTVSVADLNSEFYKKAFIRGGRPR